MLAVAPLFEDYDLDGADLGVELALAVPEGDATHVRVLTGPGRYPDAEPGSRCDGMAWTCEDISADGVDAELVLEPGNPEEDPGVVSTVAQRRDRWVLVYGYGPLVGQADAEQPADVRALADTVTAVARTPRCGLRTSTAYVDAGQELCHGDAWRRWYGDGNGYSEPDGYRDWCATVDEAG